MSPSAFLGVLGATGLTAWIGVKEIGRPQPGETFVVSAAAGAVGSVAGQIAKIQGARVVGIAGGETKCALLTDHLGFDATVEYRASSWHHDLVTATPDGIDVDFENVGGAIMEAVFARLNIRSRVVLCGLISGYNDADPQPGPRSFANLLVQRATLQGFIVLDHLDRLMEAATELAGWIRDGKAQADRDGDRGLRTATAGHQHAVRRRQHRQARITRLRLAPSARPSLAAVITAVVSHAGTRTSRRGRDRHGRDPVASNPRGRKAVGRAPV